MSEHTHVWFTLRNATDAASLEQTCRRLLEATGFTDAFTEAQLKAVALLADFALRRGIDQPTYRIGAARLSGGGGTWEVVYCDDVAALTVAVEPGSSPDLPRPEELAALEPLRALADTLSIERVPDAGLVVRLDATETPGATATASDPAVTRPEPPQPATP